MNQTLSVSNNIGEYTSGVNNGTIEEVKFRDQYEIYRNASPIFPHESWGLITFPYAVFVSMGKPTKIRITTITEVTETLDQIVRKDSANQT